MFLVFINIFLSFLQRVTTQTSFPLISLHNSTKFGRWTTSVGPLVPEISTTPCIWLQINLAKILVSKFAKFSCMLKFVDLQYQISYSSSNQINSVQSFWYLKNPILLWNTLNVTHNLFHTLCSPICCSTLSTILLGCLKEPRIFSALLSQSVWILSMAWKSFTLDKCSSSLALKYIIQY